jgi:hypothetical protein
MHAYYANAYYIMRIMQNLAIARYGCTVPWGMAGHDLNLTPKPSLTLILALNLTLTHNP